ncbi:hypothetical protein D3C85_1519560 [compost metagenome]
MLYPVHDVQVEEAVEKTDVQRGHRIGGQKAYRPGVRKLQIFDDDAGFSDVARVVHQ